jgi:hypothetical protein
MTITEFAEWAKTQIDTFRDDVNQGTMPIRPDQAPDAAAGVPEGMLSEEERWWAEFEGWRDAYLDHLAKKK